MRKRIGILTFQRTTNYGAQLQNYALQEYLKQFNDLDITVINYYNKQVDFAERRTKIKDYKGKKGFIKYFLVGYQRKIKWKKFENFRKEYINLSNEYTKDNIKQCVSKYDYFLVGSDQVWNTDITDNDFNYMLDFVTDDSKKYSYAASIGMNDIDEDNRNKIINNLKKFQKINVREETAKELLERMNIKNAKVTIDPVFLMEKDEWINKLNLVPKKGNYILVYMIDNYKENIKRIKKFAKRKNLSVVYINNNIFNTFGVDNIKTASPKEFLEYLYGAKYVITGSFHAISFSLIFNKNFYYVLYKNNRSSRITDLMKKLEIENKDITETKEVNETNIDYKQINLKKKKEIEKSKEILKEMLNEWK